jgi:hypothetical protein
MKDDIIVGVRTSSRQHKILYLGFDVGRRIPVKVKLQGGPTLTIFAIRHLIIVQKF